MSLRGAVWASAPLIVPPPRTPPRRTPLLSTTAATRRTISVGAQSVDAAHTPSTAVASYANAWPWSKWAVGGLSAARAAALFRVARDRAARQSLTAIMTGVMVCSLLLFFKEPIMGRTAQDTAEVTSRVIADPAVNHEVLELSRGVVRQILRDDQSVTELVDILRRLVQQPEAQDELKDLVLRVFSERRTIDGTRTFVSNVFDDDWMQDKVTRFARQTGDDLLNDQELRQKGKDWLKDVFKDALRSDVVRSETGDALKAAALQGFGLQKRGATKPCAEAEVRELRAIRDELEKQLKVTREYNYKLQDELMWQDKQQMEKEILDIRPIYHR